MWTKKDSKIKKLTTIWGKYSAYLYNLYNRQKIDFLVICSAFINYKKKMKNTQKATDIDR